MKLLTPLLLAVTLASSAVAGPSYDYSKGGGKSPIAPLPPVIDCFDPGFSLGLFGGVNFPSHHGDAGAGGGILAEYFFTEYFGVQVDYGAYATSPVHHSYDGNLVFRYPIKSLCIAPYLLLGGGGVSNGSTHGVWEAGAGIEARIKSMNCMGIFLDGVYHWSGDDRSNDFTIARLGVKFRF